MKDFILSFLLKPADEKKIYRKVERQYRTEDAKRHVAELIEYGSEENVPILSVLDEDDFDCLAERFLSKYDCNIDENSQWEGLILDYIN